MQAVLVSRVETAQTALGIRWRLVGLVLFVIPVVSRGDAQTPTAGNRDLPSSIVAEAQHPLDPAIDLIRRCRAEFIPVRDYTATLLRQERVGGELRPIEVIEAKFRTEPFSVYFRWISPDNGREEIYVEGDNNNMIVAHSTGFARFLFGTYHIDPDGPKARRQGRHSIREAGLANLMDKLLGRWQFERQFDETEVEMCNVKLNGRPCVLITAVHPLPDTRKYMFHTLRVYVDREWRVPVRMEGYGFPDLTSTSRETNEPATGPLLECYTYLDLQFNPGLTAQDFSPGNSQYRYSRL